MCNHPEHICSWKSCWVTQVKIEDTTQLSSYKFCICNLHYWKSCQMSIPSRYLTISSMTVFLTEVYQVNRVTVQFSCYQCHIYILGWNCIRWTWWPSSSPTTNSTSVFLSESYQVNMLPGLLPSSSSATNSTSVFSDKMISGEQEWLSSSPPTNSTSVFSTEMISGEYCCHPVL